MTPQADPIIRTHKTPELIGLSLASIYRAAKEGRIQIIKLGQRSSGIRLSEIERFIAEAQK